jgi:SAM-dependent methyltransferase
MDLHELTALQKNRHPWEKARVKFVQKILSVFNAEPKTVLDIGCGDGFIAEQLLKGFSFSSYVGLDVNLSAEQITSYSKRIPFASFCNDRKHITGKRFDLILLLDVLEHLKDDSLFLQEIVSEYTTDKAKVLITVPAFPALFGSHDAYLGHHRRYGKKNLQTIVKNAQLYPLATGYIFSSLLAIRFISLVGEKMLPRKPIHYSGVGKWDYPPFFTKSIEGILQLDNNILFFAARRGLMIPGLSQWIICEKQQ